LEYFDIEVTSNDDETVQKIHLLVNDEIADTKNSFDWIIQYETPEIDDYDQQLKIERYLAENKSSRALLFLLPTEIEYISSLKQ